MVSLNKPDKPRASTVTRASSDVTRASSDVTQARSDDTRHPRPAPEVAPHSTSTHHATNNTARTRSSFPDAPLQISSNLATSPAAARCASFGGKSGSFGGKTIDRETRGGSLKTSHEMRKKRKEKKLLISGPLYIEPINGKEFKKFSPTSVRRQPMGQESFSAFLEHEVYMHSVLLAEQQQVRTAQLRGVAPDHGTRGAETISFNEEDETCVCVSHYDNEHLNQEFDLNIEKMYKLLFNDVSTVQSKMRTLLKMEDYEASSWHDSVEGASERTLTYKVPLNANLGPKWAEVIEKQVFTTDSVATKCYVINCEVTNPNVPYGDKFNIVKRYCVTRSGDKSCKLRLTSDVQYKKGVWGMVKSIIEKNSKEGINDYCEDLCMCLQEESAGPGIKIRKSTSAAAHTSASSTRQSRPRSQAATPDSQSRARGAVSFVTENYIAFILLMMAVLLILNLVLVYRLSSITTTCSNQFDILSSLPQSEEGKSEWIRLLSQQQDLHKKEIERWQDVLRWISRLVSEVHGSLEKLHKSSIYLGSRGWEPSSSVDKTEL